MKQNIIYICQDGEMPSGVATYGYHLVKNLPDARMLLLNAARPPVACPPGLRSRLILVNEENSHSSSVLAGLLSRIVRRTKGGVVILPNTGDTPWAATAEFLRGADGQTRARVRVLGIVHGDLETQYSLAETYLPIAALWVGVSRHCAREVRKRINHRGGKVFELPYPVEIPVRVAKRREGPLKIAYAGRLEEPQKRISRLVKIFTGLLCQGVKYKATVAGDGPAALEFKQAIKAAGLQGTVKIPGSLSRSEINKIWKKHDIFILTSAYEGLPLALLEAMAHGLCPTVMAVKSGLPDILVDGHNARVVPQGDSEAMTDVLKQLSGDRVQIRRLAARARRDVSARFSPEKHFMAFKKILQQLRHSPVPAPEHIRPDATSLAVDSLVVKMSRSEKEIVVYGTGMFGRKVVDRGLAMGLKIAAMIDSDPARKGIVYRGIKCHGPDKLHSFKGATFAVGSLQFIGPIRKKILQAFRPLNKKPLILSA